MTKDKTINTPIYESLIQFELVFSICIEVTKLLHTTMEELLNDTHKTYSMETIGNTYLSFLAPDGIKDYRHELYGKYDDVYYDKEKLKKSLKGHEDLTDFSDLEEINKTANEMFNTNYLRFYWFANHYKDCSQYDFSVEYTLLLKSTRRLVYDLIHLSAMRSDRKDMLKMFDYSLERAKKLVKLTGPTNNRLNIIETIKWNKEQNERNEVICSELGIDIPYDVIPF